MAARDGWAGGIAFAIFDLDGTLVDSAADLAAAVDAAFAAESLPAPGETRLRRWIGGGARAMLERAWEWAGVPAGVDPQRLYSAFLGYYQEHLAVHTRPYPGVVAALERLAEAGVGLAVATNKSERLARFLLADLHLQDRFAAIVGGDTYAEKKPAATPLLELARRCGFTPAAAVMIGDGAGDILAAHAAGMNAWAAAWGYADPAALAALGAERVLAAPREISEALGIADAGSNPVCGGR